MPLLDPQTLYALFLPSARAQPGRHYQTAQRFNLRHPTWKDWESLDDCDRLLSLSMHHLTEKHPGKEPERILDAARFLSFSATTEPPEQPNQEEDPLTALLVAASGGYPTNLFYDVSHPGGIARFTVAAIAACEAYYLTQGLKGALRYIYEHLRGHITEKNTPPVFRVLEMLFGPAPFSLLQGPRDVGELLGVEKSRIYYLKKQYKLGQRVGKHTFFTPEDISLMAGYVKRWKKKQEEKRKYPPLVLK